MQLPTKSNRCKMLPQAVLRPERKGQPACVALRILLRRRDAAPLQPPPRPPAPRVGAPDLLAVVDRPDWEAQDHIGGDRVAADGDLFAQGAADAGRNGREAAQAFVNYGIKIGQLVHCLRTGELGLWVAGGSEEGGGVKLLHN